MMICLLNSREEADLRPDTQLPVILCDAALLISDPQETVTSINSCFLQFVPIIHCFQLSNCRPNVKETCLMGTKTSLEQDIFCI